MKPAHTTTPTTMPATIQGHHRRRRRGVRGVAAIGGFAAGLGRHPIQRRAGAGGSVRTGLLLVAGDWEGRRSARFDLGRRSHRCHDWTAATLVPAVANQTPSHADIPDDWTALVTDPSENVRVALLVIAEPEHGQGNDNPVRQVSARSAFPCHSPRCLVRRRKAPTGGGLRRRGSNGSQSPPPSGGTSLAPGRSWNPPTDLGRSTR